MFFHILDIESGLCNLRCSYCFLTQGGIEETVRVGDELMSYHDGKLTHDYPVSVLLNNICRILDSVEATVLVVLGGELFLLPEVLDFLVKRAYKYDKIRIITNGINLHKYDLSKLSPEKFCFQVSLDGASLQANKFRFPSEKTLEQIIENLHLLLKLGYIVEINCVLTTANIEHLQDFAKYVKGNFPGVMIYPFPVRFFRGDLSINTENAKIIHRVLEDQEIADILPPRAYLEELLVAITGQRIVGCYLPLLAISGSEDGSINLCPCAMLKARGNLLTEIIAPLELTMAAQDARDVLNFEYRACKSCFTHFDIVNLFIENRISESEMQKSGMFRDTLVFEALKGYKEKILEQGGGLC